MSENKQQALADITRAVMNLLDTWKIQDAHMHEMLALPKQVKIRHIGRYRRGEAVLPDDPAVLRRAQYLLRIADALRTAYPMNPKMSGRWIHQGQRRFGRRTPFSMIMEGGETGLVAVPLPGIVPAPKQFLLLDNSTASFHHGGHLLR